MAFDGIVMKALAAELKKDLAGGKIEKIYQPDHEQLILHIHAKGLRKKLYISCASSRAAVRLTETVFENPATPPMFCMLLRKHLIGGRIDDIRQTESERILEIDVRTFDEIGFTVNKRLIIEIMGKHSNIVLLDSASGKIMDSIKRVSGDFNRIRQLLPGKIYEYPPSQEKKDFDRITYEDCLAVVSTGRSKLAGAFLAAIMGISPGIAANLAELCEHRSDEDAAARVFEAICDMRAHIAAATYTPAVYLTEDNIPTDFHIFPLVAFDRHCKKKHFPDVSTMTEYYFSNKAAADQLRQKGADLQKTVKNSLQKLRLKKQRLCEDILEAQNSEELRLFGELLTANLHNIVPGSSEAVVINYYDNREVRIPLDIRHTPAKNAQMYFKRYGKAHTAVREKTLRLKETEQEIEYLESVGEFIETTDTPAGLEAIRAELAESGYLKKKKGISAAKKAKPMPYTYTSPSGFRVQAGRNNSENDLLTFKSASSRDIWFHTKDIPGSHVILFTENTALEDIAEADIFFAASIAVLHSKGKNSENVPVDYVPVKFVKKPNGAKPGMVIFTNNRTVWTNPARI